MSLTPPAQEWDTDRVFTIPNILSFIRLAGVFVFGWLILAGHDVWAVVLLAVFGATDWLDGYLARKLNQRTALGARLDPVADRLYILMAIIALFVRGIVPWWMLAVLLVRDIMLVLLVPILKRTGRVALPVNTVGKAATMFLLVAFPVMLLGAPQSLGFTPAWWLGWACAVVGAILYWVAGVMYVQATVRLTRDHRQALDASP